MIPVTDEHDYVTCGLRGCSFIMAHSHGTEDCSLDADQGSRNFRIYKARQAALKSHLEFYHDYVIDGEYQICVHHDARSREECIQAHQEEKMSEPAKQRKGDQTLPMGSGGNIQEMKDPYPTKQPDMVSHPPHYKRGGMEAIDVIEAFDLGFCLGNTIKYVLRAGHKGDRLEDLRKSRWYLDREIANEEKSRSA